VELKDRVEKIRISIEKIIAEGKGDGGILRL
jgi:hypothetical protein